MSPTRQRCKAGGALWTESIGSGTGAPCGTDEVATRTARWTAPMCRGANWTLVKWQLVACRPDLVAAAHAARGERAERQWKKRKGRCSSRGLTTARCSARTTTTRWKQRRFWDGIDGGNLVMGRTVEAVDGFQCDLRKTKGEFRGEMGLRGSEHCRLERERKGEAHRHLGRGGFRWRNRTIMWRLRGSLTSRSWWR